MSRQRSTGDSTDAPAPRRLRRWRWVVASILILSGGYATVLLAWNTIDHFTTHWVETSAKITSYEWESALFQEDYQVATISYQTADEATLVGKCTSTRLGGVGDTIPAFYSDSDPTKVTCNDWSWGSWIFGVVVFPSFLLGGLLIIRRERAWQRWKR